MGNFLPVLVLGISYGLVMFLLATGMTLTMGLLRVVNMSHGAIYMFAGFCGVWIYKISGSWIAAVFGGAVVGALIGLLLEVFFLRRLYKTPTNQVLLTIGIIYIIQNITQWIWGGLPANAPIPSFIIGGFKVGDVTIPYFRIFIIVFGIIMTVVIWLIQEKSKMGAMVRAGMDNNVIAGTMGINTRLVFTMTFVLGSLVAGMSSMVGGSLTGLGMGTCWSVLLNAIIVVVIGGAGSIPGALIGGIIIGLVNAFGAVYTPALSSFLIYIVLIIILLIRPQGLMGRKMDVNKADDSYATAGAESVRPLFKPAADAGKFKRFAYYKGPFVIVSLILVIFPFISGPYAVSIMTEVLIYALFAASLDILMGYIGNRSFGHAAFFGMGAYSVALMSKHFGIKNFWVVLPVTLVVCVILAAVISYLTLHLRGTNFLLVTMAFGQLLNAIAIKWQSVTNGTDGLSAPRPDMWFLSGLIGKWNGTKIYFFTLFFFGICFVIIFRFMASSFGTSLLGIKNNEGRMMALGYNTGTLRFIGFVIAGLFAGVAGMLYAYAKPTVDPNIFGIETSALPMLMVIIGGSGTLWGPALGALVIIIVKNYSGILFAERWPLVLGIIYVLCVMFFSGGFAPYLIKLRSWFGRKIFSNTINNNNNNLTTEK
ncbi:MAG: ABC transporter permease [Lachnospiraceae bacterium]